MDRKKRLTSRNELNGQMTNFIELVLQEPFWRTFPTSMMDRTFEKHMENHQKVFSDFKKKKKNYEPQLTDDKYFSHFESILTQNDFFLLFQLLDVLKMTSAPSFYWYDYIVFLSTLAVSIFIGIYIGCFGSKQTTSNDYLMGHKKMKKLPVGLSIAISHFSAVTFISVPADTYRYGAYFLFACISPMLVAAVTIFVYLPVFFNLQITSIYEYLEKRFDRRTRLLGSFLYILFETTISAFMIYPPSLIVSASTGINVNIICIGLFLICVFYTAIGGLRTVIWTDLFQFIIVGGCLILICGIGFFAHGGVGAVWKKAIEGGRFDIFDFNLDPTRRDSFWVYIIGHSSGLIAYMSLSQGGMQKYLTLAAFRKCLWSAIYSAISLSIVSILTVSIGLILYAEYSQCDPILSKQIRRHDEMIAYYVLGTMKHFYGISGLFFAALSCASLSSVSCSLNAMSAVVYKDFVSRYLSRNISEKKVTNIIKLIVVLCGVVSICIMQLIQHVKEIMPAAASVIGTISGPSMGIFTLAVLFPQANAKGAFFGGIGGFLLVASTVFPRQYYQSIIYPPKPISILGCESNLTLATNSTITNFGTPTIPFVFRICHHYNCLIGVLTTIILGLVISKITKSSGEVDENLISPLVRKVVVRESGNNGNVLENRIDERDE